VIFARFPRPGEVKTRLSPVFTAGEACEIHLALVGDVVEGATRAVGSAASIFLSWSEPAEGSPPIESLPAGIVVEHQTGRDLGERMALAIQSKLAAGFKRVVILGSDAPTLPADHLESAFDSLRSCEVVIGPSEDGGYYLVGMSRLHLEIFRGIRWGGDEVLKATRQRLRHSGVRYQELGMWHDVDLPGDVGRLWRDLLRLKERHGSGLPERTWRVLSRLVPGRIPL
jgi:hypothetical protein